MPNVIADLVIMPIGTAEAGISKFVAASELILKEFPEIQYRINAMSTTLEGDLTVMMALIRRMHEAPFLEGADRVSTTIRIDDRRDRVNTMDDKIESVKRLAGLS